MSTALPSSARRRFLTRFLSEPSLSALGRQPRNLHDWRRQTVTDRTDDGTRAGVLWGLWASGPDEVFAVGDAGVVLHWDGRRWVSEPSGTRLPLHAVCGSADGTLFAVGWMGIICERRAGQWVAIQGGETDASGRRYQSCRSNQPLFAVCSDPSGGVWAVGDHGRILCYRGGHWQEMDSGVTGHLRGIVGLADGSLMACGRNGLIIRWDGDAWCPMRTGTGADLNRLWARSPDDIYALGGSHDPATNGSLGCLLHFDGDHWSQVPARGRIERLRGVAGDAQDLVLVGDYGGVYRLADGMIERIGQSGGPDLLDIALFPNHALAVGDLGTVLRSGMPTTTEPEVETDAHADADADVGTRPQHRTRPSRWHRVGAGITDRTLHAIWAAPSGRLFAVGEAGTILIGEGNRWESMEAPNRLDLRGIWGSSERHLFACGERGSLLHYDGTGWQEMHRMDTQTTALAITGFGPHDVFVVGDQGLVLRYDGVDWRRLPSGTKSALYGLWGADADHLLAVGDLGLVLRWNGHDLQAFQIGTESFLFGVWGEGLSDIHVTGQAGTLAHFDGARWSLLRAGSDGASCIDTRADLLAVAGRPGLAALAVGSRGTALWAKAGTDGRRHWVAEETHCEASLRALCLDQMGDAYAVGDGGTLLYRPVG